MLFHDIGNDLQGVGRPGRPKAVTRCGTIWFVLEVTGSFWYANGLVRRFSRARLLEKKERSRRRLAHAERVGGQR